MCEYGAFICNWICKKLSQFQDYVVAHIYFYNILRDGNKEYPKLSKPGFVKALDSEPHALGHQK